MPSRRGIRVSAADHHLCVTIPGGRRQVHNVKLDPCRLVIGIFQRLLTLGMEQSCSSASRQLRLELRAHLMDPPGAGAADSLTFCLAIVAKLRACLRRSQSPADLSSAGLLPLNLSYMSIGLVPKVRVRISGRPVMTYVVETRIMRWLVSGVILNRVLTTAPDLQKSPHQMSAHEPSDIHHVMVVESVCEKRSAGAHSVVALFARRRRHWQQQVSEAAPLRKIAAQPIRFLPNGCMQPSLVANWKVPSALSTNACPSRSPVRVIGKASFLMRSQCSHAELQCF